MVDDSIDDNGTDAGEAPVAGNHQGCYQHITAESVPVAQTCLSCGAPLAGLFCVACGQKQDDLRRNLFLLARQFFEDTFAFDSRMWRTLGLLALAPGAVPSEYAHGKRSKHTPPIRLFLVVSFLFFLLLSITQTLFIAIEVNYITDRDWQGVQILSNDQRDKLEPHEIGGEKDCSMTANLMFFVRASEIHSDVERSRRCIAGLQEIATRSLLADDKKTQNAQIETDGLDINVTTNFDNPQEVVAIVNRLASSVNNAIEDPTTFNAILNNWLPRVMFFMTPLLAIIIGIFIRGRDALFFDHIVTAFYSHAVGFSIVGAAIILTQIGVPLTGLAAASFLFVYFVRTLKRTYGRGWIKTVYSSIMISIFYTLILVSTMLSIVSDAMLRG